ncbi:MAG: peptide-methionine (S)-S-oxide reductase MsrA [Hymenobacteraceae bacterium]|nr:peptide-methionine (S)-S-oxide reductase MsrA [Hymenobacteraceae bacterium]
MKTPPLDLAVPASIATATFALGCFWTPDALFGSLDGVVRTRVGYAGGTTENPSYWKLADHIETVQVDYDPVKLDYQGLLDVFFHNHQPTRAPWKRQYMSAIFYHDPEQERLAIKAKEKLEQRSGQQVYTAIYPLTKFYLAEDRHQKYKLQRQPEIMEEFQEVYPAFADFVNSTAAARVNGYQYGYGSRKWLEEATGNLGLSPAAQRILLSKASAHKDVTCGR